MEWILGILILILGGAAIVVIYLSERINVFETLLGLNPKVTSDKLAEHVTFGPNPFGDLSGENLWKAMSGEGIEGEKIDIDNLESMRPRYKLVITRHIETILEDGRFDARAKERTPVQSILRIPMLRGSVESFIPFTEASRFYEIGQEAETNPESAEKLATEVDEIVDDLFNRVKLERSTSLGRALLPIGDSSNEDTTEIDDFEESDTSGNDNHLALPPSEEGTSKTEDI